MEWGPRGKVVLVYLASIALVLAGYLAVPRLLTLTLTGVRGSSGLYYLAYTLTLAGGALATLYLRRIALRGPYGSGGVGYEGGLGGLLKLAIPALAAAAAYLGVGAILGFRPSYIGSVQASLVSAVIYVLLAVPVAVSIEASQQLGEYAPLAAVAAGFAALNPAAFRVAYSSWGPNAFIGVLVYTALAIALGLAGLSLTRRLGVASSYLLILVMLVVMAALPVRVSLGALGLLVAGASGLYVAHAASGLLVAEPVPETGGTPGAGGGDSSSPMEGGVGNDVSGEGDSKGGSARASEVRPALASGGGASRALRRPGLWALVGLAVVLVALYSAGVMFWRPMVVVTGSMEPTLKPGDAILLRKVSTASPGDLVSYRSNGMVITHRVVGVNPDGSLITKGDANNAPDPYPVSPGSIIGKVWVKIPKVGWLVLLANWNKLARLLVAAVAGIALVAVIIRW